MVICSMSHLIDFSLLRGVQNWSNEFRYVVEIALGIYLIDLISGIVRKPPVEMNCFLILDVFLFCLQICISTTSKSKTQTFGCTLRIIFRG